jgi:hypothetical protein
MVGFYRPFLPHLAAILQPLNLLLRGKPTSLAWTSAADAAFLAAKTALASAVRLAHPRFDAPLRLSTDASDIAIGAALEQFVNGAWQPLGFFSRHLRAAELRYSTFDRELLAAYCSVLNFRHLLDGRPFLLATDHKPLVGAFSKRTDALSGRQQRQLSLLAEFNCEVVYVNGPNNVVADALSRNAMSVSGFDFADLAEAQANDPELQAAVTAVTGLRWERFPTTGSTSLLCDVSTGRPRPWVPSSLRQRIFSIIHELSHPSIRSTQRLVTDRFVWHGMRRDIQTWARSCLSCQRAKIVRHVESGVGSYPAPQRRFGWINLDIVGPLPPSSGHRYLLTMIDRATRWPEAVPMVDATTESCVHAFLSVWVSRFGLPSAVTSDRGSQFVSDLWRGLGDVLGFSLHNTCAYNPAANSAVERWHRSVKAALMARCSSSADWFRQLPWILLGLRTVPKDGVDVSAAQMLYGESLTLPGEFFPASSDDPPTPDDLRRLREVTRGFIPYRPPTSHGPPVHLPAALQSAPFVFVRVDAVRRPLQPPYRGPFKVVRRGPKAFLLDLENREDWVSVDRLKPAVLPECFSVPMTSSGRAVHLPVRYRE